AKSQNTSDVTAAYVWLTIVGTLGSWAILIPSKLVEGKLEEQVPLRFTMMLLGAIVGMAAWGVADAFVLKMPAGREPFQIGGGWVNEVMLGWSRIGDGSNP